MKGAQFNSWRSVGVAAQAVRVHQTRGVDELVLLDIGATPEGRGPDLDLVRELSEVCFMPLAVGGGVSGFEDAHGLLQAGADKVVVCTGAGSLAIREIAARAGSQAVVAAIDVKEGMACLWSRGSDARVPTTKRYLSWARMCYEEGAGEILLTDMDREGTMSGYNLEIIEKVARYVPIPVIAHGGCGTYEHMRQAIEAGADAVAAGAMFLFTDATPRGAAAYLAGHGIEARV